MTDYLKALEKEEKELMQKDKLNLSDSIKLLKISTEISSYRKGCKDTEDKYNNILNKLMDTNIEYFFLNELNEEEHIDYDIGKRATIDKIKELSSQDNNPVCIESRKAKSIEVTSDSPQEDMRRRYAESTERVGRRAIGDTSEKTIRETEISVESIQATKLNADEGEKQ